MEFDTTNKIILGILIVILLGIIVKDLTMKK
jgi:hypothetical protein